MLKRHLFIISCVSLLILPVQAEVLSIADPTYQTPNSTAGVERPTRGMTMQQVEQQYGKAERRYDTTGQPPIVRWQYNAFDVYFEEQLVIHSVVRREADQP